MKHCGPMLTLSPIKAFFSSLAKPMRAIAADRYRALQMGPVADAAAGTDAHSAPHGCAWRHLGAGINVGCQCRERIGQGGEVIPPHAGTSSACRAPARGR
ncbi:hypothetical protein G6F23_015057 [Rhizopus arrhizus]|nr:hypothetical protein G6F23_015057 [Rhizopus arrhizus]